MLTIPVVVQHRHVHLSVADQEALFGTGRELTPLVRLAQHGQVVYKETVAVVGKHGVLEHIRIVGPCRAQTQVELAATDAFALGIDAKVRLSGDLHRTAPCTLQAEGKEVRIPFGTIIPARHLHLSDAQAEAANLKHMDVVSLEIPGRSEPIGHVTVRVHPTFAGEFHLTVDEACEWYLQTGDTVVLK